MEPAEVGAHCTAASSVRLGSPSPISVPDASWVGLVELGLAVTLPSYRTYIPGLQQGWGPALVRAHPFVFAMEVSRKSRAGIPLHASLRFVKVPLPHTQLQLWLPGTTVAALICGYN